MLMYVYDFNNHLTYIIGHDKEFMRQQQFFSKTAFVSELSPFVYTQQSSLRISKLIAT